MGIPNIPGKIVGDEYFRDGNGVFHGRMEDEWDIPGRLIWRFFEMSGRIMGDEFLGVLYTGDEWE